MGQQVVLAPITFKGRSFEPGEIELVREVVATCGGLSRQELANTLCELVDWRRPNLGLKTWEAEDFLERLEELGLVRLPALRRTKPRGTPTRVPRTARGEPGTPIHASLRDLQPITLRLVAASDHRRLWRELVARYHPQGHRVPFGAHLRYLVEIARPTPTVVGCIQLSSPAWTMASRDRWIGWNDEQRRLNLQRIVNQSRFLILPWVEVRNLASAVLALMARTFLTDWQRAYAVEPVLLETLVDRDRLGTCYRAANWIALGETTGRGRQDRHHRREGLAPKQVFVFPLRPRAREILRGER